MKILFIDNYYIDFLEKIESDIEKQNLTDYEKVKEHIFSYYFGTSDYYSRNIKTLGWDTQDIIINSKALQSAWSKENKKFLNILSFCLEHAPRIDKIFSKMGNPFILIEQIKKHKPDVVYVQCIGAVHPVVSKIIKRHCKLLVGQIAAKLPPDKYFLNYDLVLSSLPNIIEKINSLGVKGEYFPIAFESSILDKIPKLMDREYNVTHIGGYGSIHNERNKVLEYAAKRKEIDFWGYGTNNLKKDSPILKNFHGEAWGLDMYNILANSKITLTGHIQQVAGDYANNMTLFEATGCGALLITDWKKNLSDLFEIDKEIITYKNPQEMTEKIKYYLEHEEERKEIAKAGQQRTLKDHTYKRRMEQLDEILRRYLAN